MLDRTNMRCGSYAGRRDLDFHVRRLARPGPPFTRLLAALIVALAADRLAAQNVAVQQPTIGVFSGSTTVSVPDRGRAALGGVSRGASSRSTYGPFPMNTNYGSAFEGTSASAHVWIQDFSELDRQALDAAEGRAPRGGDFQLDSRAAHAYRTLAERRSEPRSAIAASTTRGSAASAPAAGRSASDERGSLSTEELYERGMKAEAAGKRGVARAFLRVASDRGSEAAARALATIDAARPSNSIPTKLPTSFGRLPPDDARGTPRSPR